MPFDGLTTFDYLALFQRLALAVALGLLIGGERERAGKEVGLRTFAFVALAGALGPTIGITIDPVLGQTVGLASLGIVALLIVFLNLRALLYEHTLEMTTSTALFLTVLIGMLAGSGEFFIPTAVGVLTATLLASKVPLHGFTLGLSPSEVRAALLFGVIAFVIYPMLPVGYVDPWELVNLKKAWLTVVLIAAIGLVNYVLLRLYGRRGLTYAIFLGALVNSSVAVAELARRLKLANGGGAALALHGIAIANSAMLLRNGLILAILQPTALFLGAPMVGFMLLLSLIVAVATDRRVRREEGVSLHLESPFSLRSALYFGVVLLVIAVVGDIGQRLLGEAGFLAVSIAGGLVSSASTTASAGILASQGKLSPEIASLGAVLASMTSAAIHAPLILQASQSRRVAMKVVQLTAGTLLLGVIGLGIQCNAPATQLPGLFTFR